MASGRAIVYDPDRSDKSFAHADLSRKTAAIAKPSAFWQQPALPIQ
jgi:hypothetical protein